MILVVDHYDSFTYNLVQLIESLGATTEVVKSDAEPAEALVAREPAAVVLSPGPGRPEDAGCFTELLRILPEATPVLGVCLGHQAIALACGSTVERTWPVHGKVASIRHDGSGLFGGLPSPFAATRYHSLAVPCPRPPLVANAWSEDGTVMAMRHDRAPAHGIQFHPESVASEQGKAILSKFLALSHTPA